MMNFNCFSNDTRLTETTPAYIPDSLIFDMDGTLWDNVDTYAVSWTRGMKKMGYDKEVTREDILSQMGNEIGVMLKVLVPEWTKEEQNRLFHAVIESYQELVPTMKPVIFDGVTEGLELLSQRYRLFLLSNCEEGGLVNFMNHTKTEHLITDYMEHGMNMKPKHHNLKLMIEKNGLQAPVYIGDTDSDSRESAMAVVPFVFVTYGFGEAENFNLKFDTFPELVNYYLNL
ncbi:MULTISPECIES: HAD family hydrolase [Proteiniphilum]|jgi:phosphoglycolate phosphatase|uniref:HAD family hydrolase n=1 Tax=Proteiniphilum TaxID=294702 RepID=UPI001EEB7762|nr:MULTISPECIES: HAD hydrolase-like protein [Proteiniphilum]ULB33564.1 HAD family hydrolase [Proteiniphilum propionicum]